MWMSFAPSKKKVIQFNSRVEKIEKKEPINTYNYHISIRTDCGVSFSFDIPLYDICMVSDTANCKASTTVRKDGYMPQMEAIAKSYIALLKELGIGTISYEIIRDEQHDTTE